MDPIDLDWIGLELIESEWIELDWIESEWIGLSDFRPVPFRACSSIQRFSKIGIGFFQFSGGVFADQPPFKEWIQTWIQ